MKIQYASDLHLEFSSNTTWLRENPLPVTGDVLVLAGDIIPLNDTRLRNHPFIDWCASHYQLTLIVPGNHEYYGGFPVEATLNGFELCLRPNVRYLNNRSTVVGDTEFFLTTLWTRIRPQNLMAVQLGMNDCRQISLNGNPLRADDYEQLHHRCLSWLQGALVQSKARHRVVVTHHCPVAVEDKRYASNGLTDAFIVPLEHMVEGCGADYWIFGHTHYNAARGLRLGSTTLLCNQLGYVKQGIITGWNPASHVEVDFMP